MCRMQVRVIEVDDDKLAAPWCASIGDNGERVLFVRRTARPAEVAEGYSAALRQCAVRRAHRISS